MCACTCARCAHTHVRTYTQTCISPYPRMQRRLTGDCVCQANILCIFWWVLTLNKYVFVHLRMADQLRNYTEKINELTNPKCEGVSGKVLWNPVILVPGNTFNKGLVKVEGMLIRSACTIAAESRANPLCQSRELLQTSASWVTNELNQTGDFEIFIHSFFFFQQSLFEKHGRFWGKDLSL